MKADKPMVSRLAVSGYWKTSNYWLIVESCFLSKVYSRTQVCAVTYICQTCL